MAGIFCVAPQRVHTNARTVSELRRHRHFLPIYYSLRILPFNTIFALRSSSISHKYTYIEVGRTDIGPHVALNARITLQEHKY